MLIKRMLSILFFLLGGDKGEVVISPLRFFLGTLLGYPSLMTFFCQEQTLVIEPILYNRKWQVDE